MATSIDERIKTIRIENKLTQKEFGEGLGITPSYVSKLESAKETPSDTLLKLICATFNINFDWLKYGIGEKNSLNTKLVKQDAFENIQLFQMPVKEILPNSDYTEQQLYAACYSVLTAILMNRNVTHGSQKTYHSSIQMVLYTIHSFLKLSQQLKDDDMWMAIKEHRKLMDEATDNIKKHLDQALEACKISDLDDNLNNNE